MTNDVELAYYCEIAFCMWANNIKFKCDKILEKYDVDFDYDDRPMFYAWLYKYFNMPFPSCLAPSLLQQIYYTINNGLVYGLFDKFLAIQYPPK